MSAGIGTLGLAFRRAIRTLDRSTAGTLFTLSVSTLLATAFSLGSIQLVAELAYSRAALTPAFGTATSCYRKDTRGEGCVVTYTHDGVDYRLDVEGKTHQVGDQVPLRYDPSQPSTAYRADTEGY